MAQGLTPQASEPLGGDPAPPGADLRPSAGPIVPWRRPVSWAFDRLLAGYQRFISPMFPPACRFTPSCSSYARGCLRAHVLPRALALIVWRLLRCQPLCPGGHDPVPQRRAT